MYMVGAAALGIISTIGLCLHVAALLLSISNAMIFLPIPLLLLVLSP